jgi:copper chaperone CopZ
MLATSKSVLLIAAALTGSAIVAPARSASGEAAVPQIVPIAAQVPDTAIVRLHISGMTCGSCPLTARLALKRLSGVYSATVTLDDSLGVVRYDATRVTPSQIAAQLVRLTGFVATVLPDSTRSSRRPSAGNS